MCPRRGRGLALVRRTVRTSDQPLSRSLKLRRARPQSRQGHHDRPFTQAVIRSVELIVLLRGCCPTYRLWSTSTANPPGRCPLEVNRDRNPMSASRPLCSSLTTEQRTSDEVGSGPISDIRQCERKSNYRVRTGFPAGMGAGVIKLL
jgi:hypothetical protein